LVVDQARGKGGGRGVQYIPVGPVRLDVVLHSPAPWWGIRGDPSTGGWMIGDKPSTELVSRSP